MIFSTAARNAVFKLSAIFSLLAATYHTTGLFYKINESPVWRHGLFICINLFCIYGALKRPKYFLFLFCILLVQQYYSHGSHLLRLWKEEHQVHWISAVELILLPVALICLVEDYRINHTKEKRSQSS